MSVNVRCFYVIFIVKILVQNNGHNNQWGTQRLVSGDSRVSAEVHSREDQNFSEEGFGKVLGKPCKQIQVQRLQDKH